MRVQSMTCALALAAATPAVAQEAAPAQPAALVATATAPDACAVTPAAVEQPQPRRRRGLGGLLRAVGSSGAMNFIPGLGMVGQVAGMAASTAAAASTQSQQDAVVAEAQRQNDAAMRLAQCQMRATTAATAAEASGG